MIHTSICDAVNNFVGEQLTQLIIQLNIENGTIRLIEMQGLML